MSQEKPSFSRSAKTQLMRRFVQRYPTLEPTAFEAVAAVLDAGRKWESIVDHHLELEGLSQGRYYVLLFLFREEGSSGLTSPSRIADGLNITRPTVTWLLDSLDRDGFVERRQDAQDRRAQTVSLTEKGRAFLDSFLPAHALRINAAMARLSEEERVMLKLLVEKTGLLDPPQEAE